MPETGILIVIGLVLAVPMVFTFVVLLTKQYKRCPSNRVLVIYGRTKRGQAARTVHGGAAFVVPLLQDYAYLSLEPIQIEIPLRGALSIENIRVNVPSVFTVAVGTEPAVMQNAARSPRSTNPMFPRPMSLRCCRSRFEAAMRSSISARAWSIS